MRNSLFGSAEHPFLDEDIVCSNRKLLVNTRFDFDILLTTNNQQIISGICRVGNLFPQEVNQETYH